MIGLRRVLFLVGTFTLVSCKALLPNIALEIAKPLTGRLIEREHGAPFISNFIQEGTNVFFKPHFSMTSHLEQPHAIIVEDKYCDKGPLKLASVLSPALMEEPQKIVETVIPSNELEPSYLKQIIEIKPRMPENVMSMAPAPVFVSKPTVYPEAPFFSPMPLPINDALVPELPTLPMSITPLPTPALVEEPVMIPESPVLPAFTMPELPALSVIEAQRPVMPIPELTVPIEPAAVMVEEPVFIPEAPVLPTAVAGIAGTSFPMVIEESLAIPEAPMLPTLVRSDLPAPTLVEVPAPMPVVPALESVVIPEAPVLPPFVMPELPTIVEAKPAPIPNMIEEPVEIAEVPVLPKLVIPEVPIPRVVEESALMPFVPALEPVFIPEAPVLPPFVMPKLPTIDEIRPAPVPTMIEEPLVIPESPELPTLVMPEIPAPMIVEEPAPMTIVPALEPVIIPEAPILPPFIMPELPNPPMHEVMPELPVLAPVDPASVVVEEPLVIPEAPLLPPMTFPELPSPVVLEEKIPVKEFEIERPVFISSGPAFPQQPCVYPFTFPCPLGPYPHPVGASPPYMPFVDVSQAPFAPFTPALSQAPMHNERTETNNVIMSSLPTSLLLPTECAQDVIAERILSNAGMAGQAFVAAPALTNPVPAPYIRL